MTYIPDPSELIEIRAEIAMERLNYDPKTDMIDCASCRKRISLMEGHPLSPDPAAPGVCDECLDLAQKGLLR